MKKHISILVFFCISYSLWGQVGISEPSWVQHVPQAPSYSGFYYAVSEGSGSTLQKAYDAALNNAVKEALLRKGVRFTTEVLDDGSTIVRAESSTMNIPINVACKYWREAYSPHRYIMFILWQIANDANYRPKWEAYDRCHED